MTHVYILGHGKHFANTKILNFDEQMMGAVKCPPKVNDGDNNRETINK